MDKTSASKETSEPNEQEREKKPLGRRIVVTVIFLTSLSMCIFETNEIIFLYLSKPIETQIKMTVNDAMEFPAVTICNLNPVRRSRWEAKTNENRNKRFHSKIQTAAHSATVTGKNKKVNESPSSHDNSFKKNRLKRQSSEMSMWTKIYNGVNANSATISRVNEATKNLTAEARKRDLILNDFHANVSKLRTSFNESSSSLKYLANTIKDLESRLSVAELTTAEIVEEMAKTKSFLKALVKNASKVVDVKTENVTEEKVEEVKKLPPSKDLEAFNDYIKNIGRMTKEDIQTIGHQKKDFIAICSWQGGICDSSHFDAFQNFMYGNCFTFNTSKVDSQVSLTGPRNGLSLSLFIEQNEYIDRLAPAAGARVVIHDFDYRPFPEDDGFSVVPGHTTAVFLRKSTTETLKPWCDPDIETSFERNGQKLQYSQKACLKQCLSDEILRQCNCAGIQFLLDTKTCSEDNEREAECVQRLEYLARKDKLPCYCPATCRSTTYNPMISTALWPSEKYLPSLLEELVRVEHKVLELFENVTDFARYFRKHFLRIDIFFQELTEQETFQRYSYGLEKLFSDIGGQLGLWIGVSVATLYESIESLTIVFISIMKWIQNRRLKLRTISPSPVTKTAASYKVEAARNSVSRDSVHYPFQFDINEGLGSSASRTSSRFLHVHFKETEVT